jgi:hypothetical protein
MAATRKAATKKTATRKKTAAKKIAATKTTAKKTTRTYSPAASDQVRTEIDAMKAGTLRSGGSGEKVTNRKQAIAIGLSEARRAGKNVPPNPNRTSRKHP